MLLQPWIEVIEDPDKLNFSAAQVANWPGYTRSLNLSTDGPIESINIVATLTMKAVAANQVITFGLLNFLKSVTLNVHDPIFGQYDAVLASGPGLLTLQEVEGLPLDEGTIQALWMSNANRGAAGNSIAVGEVVRLHYRINCAHPGLRGFLAARSYIHCQRHKQEPILTMQFAPTGEMFASTADPFSAVQIDVFTERREISDALTDELLAKGGMIQWDVRETQQHYPAGLSNKKQKIELPSGREYAAFSLWHESNGVDLEDLSGSVTLGQETLWSLKAGSVTKSQWRMKYLQLLLAQTRGRGVAALPYPLSDALPVDNTGTTSGTALVNAKILSHPPRFGGTMTAGLCIQEPAVVGMEFLRDGNSPVDELSSALNARFEGSTKWAIEGEITTPAGNPSWIKVCARSFLSDITRYKRLPVVE